MTQQLNEIKKKLYKEKPNAHFYSARKDGLLYTTGFGIDTISFLIPLTEIGETIWERDMPSHLLIRYIVLNGK